MPEYTMSDFLSEDLMFEIFTRLPVISLLQFRSVSKLICSLIGSPEFIRIHTFQSPQKVFIRHRYSSIEKEEEEEEEEKYIEDFYTIHSEDQLPVYLINGFTGTTPVRFPSEESEVIGSCNGIICLFNRKLFSFTLWNPSIRRKLTLPRNPWKYISKTHSVAFGFGFDQITQDYKIVTFFYPHPRVRNVDTSFLVYSMKTNVLSEIASPTTMFPYWMSRACFVNGTFHWAAKHCLDYFDETGNSYIMTFDLTTHVFGTIELREPSWDTIDLTIIKGSLGVVSWHRDIIWIWAMKESSNPTSWSVVSKIEANIVDGETMGVLQLTNGDFLLNNTIPPKKLLEGVSSWFQVYHSRTRVRSGVLRFNNCCDKVDMNMYAESLELLNMGSACKGNQPSFLPGEK